MATGGNRIEALTVRYGRLMGIDTVSYGMPPEGYETVTLPTDALEKLDELAQGIGASSRSEAIKALVEDYDPRMSAYVVEVDSGVATDLANVIAPKVAEEVEQRMTK